MPEHVKVQQQGAVATVTIQRPDKRNALDAATRSALVATFAKLRADDSVRVVVLTGSGKAFVSGADVSEFVDKTPVTILHDLIHEPAIIDLVDQFPKPVIAMINGYCLGSGNELAMACDIRIASEDAKFGQPEVNLGMIPGGGATQRLPRIVGMGRALMMMYTGNILDSTEALRIGLVDFVVPATQLRARTMVLAEVIATKSPVALAMIKEATRASVRAPLDDGIRHEQSLASVIFASKDMQEGLKAFLEKRQPKFTGE
jgi:enoyl-CoA hydratase